MANARGKAIDTTCLSIDQAEKRGFLHRDYIAHCLRWTHVAKYLNAKNRYKTARVLDIGCGKEMPLPKLLHSSRMAPEWYGGVDMVALPLPDQFANSKFKPTLFEKTDVTTLTTDDIGGKVNTISCFEVIEHVEPEKCLAILDKFKEFLSDDGRAFISTPAYDEKTGAAANHVNEMTYGALGAILEKHGFEIEGHWGTFASMKDYKPHLTPAELEVYESMSNYYDTNYLSTIFAPLYPQYSRNVIWQLKHRTVISPVLFDVIENAPKPWGSSEHWQDLAK